MDEESFDAETSRLQIKKLKEKVKSLVTEVDLSREIRSDDFPKMSKFQLDRSLGDISSDLDSIDVDGDEFLDIKEAEFANEGNWLIDWNSNCNTDVEPSSDIFSALYSEVEDCNADVGDLYRELQLLRNSSTEPKGTNNRNAFIDSRTFTRPKKYISRPPLTSIISNSSEDSRRGKLQRRLTTTVSPTPSIINKLEDLNRLNKGVYGESNWEDGSQEGLADIENTTAKSQRKTFPASIIDRLQELKRSNNSYVISKTPSEPGRRMNLVNGNVDDSEELNFAEDARKVKDAFELNVRNSLSTSCGSDIFRNIPEYFSDDNESFFSLDEVSGFCDRLTLSTDPNTYSSIFREMEQSEICFYHSDQSPGGETSVNRMTFGGMEIPIGNLSNNSQSSYSRNHLVDIEGELNKTYEVLSDSSSKGSNATFEMKNRDNQQQSESNSGKKYDSSDGKSNLVDVILKSDIINNVSPNYGYKYCDNRNGNGGEGDRVANNSGEKFNKTYTQNELNKMHSEKYTTKLFDSSYKKSDRSNGKRESDQSEDDCMSTTSDNSCRSVESNSELKNIEELKNIALQQNRKLADVKFSTPKLQGSNTSNSRHSDEWRNVSPIRRDFHEGESQGSSNSSSRGTSPRRSSLSPLIEAPLNSRTFLLRPPPLVPQRELKLKPALIRPSNLRKPANNARPSMKSATVPKNDCKTSTSATGMPSVKQSVTPVAAVSSTTNTRPVTRIPSGIPRPPSRLKQPQIRASEVYKK